jgi:membrane-associated phospholipid phosphatase
MIGPERLEWSVASTVGLAGLAALTWLDLARREDGTDLVWVSLESVTWALGLTEAAKTAFGRKRPVLYTIDAPEAAEGYESTRSLPSGHTAAAFAIATSYWLSTGERSGAARWAAMLAALGVGTLRVAARRHFPSDAVAGAALGVATAVVVHEIRF